jgi:hypothetical protein
MNLYINFSFYILHFTFKKLPFGSFLNYSPLNGKSAITLARLIALASSR